MGNIIQIDNGIRTIYVNGQDISSLSAETNTYYIGVDLNSGSYEKKNPNGTIVNLETSNLPNSIAVDSISANTLNVNSISNRFSVIGSKGAITTDGSTTQAFFTVSGSSSVGGTGYTDFLRVVNTAIGSTTPNKTFRLNINGTFEIIDSAYSLNIFSLDDSGNLTIFGRVRSNVNYSQAGGGTGVNLPASGDPQTIVSTTITTYGNPVRITAYGDAENSGAGYWSKLQIWRGSTAIGAIVHTEGSAGSENTPFAFSYIDNPVAGTYTYFLKANEISGGSIKFGESTAPIINVQEL